MSTLALTESKGSRSRVIGSADRAAPNCRCRGHVMNHANMVSLVLIPVYNHNCIRHYIALRGEGAVVPLCGRVAQAGQEMDGGV